ncbi:YfhO family protein [Candidatus Sumerlaeota bacterium]|nr:YfhO family protein [Candidatus Sumerlaeota bacterium]
MKILNYKAFLILLLPFLLFLPAILSNRMPFFMDPVTQFYPYRCAVSLQLKSGRLPLWTSSMYGGMPLLANPQVAVFYPFNWLFFMLPRAGVFTFLHAVHIYLLGIGVYFWLCARRFSRAASLGAAMIGMLSGATWAHLAFGAYLNTMALFPWTLFFFEKFRRSGRKKWFFGITVCAALQILTGAPQAVYYSFIVYVGWALLNLTGRKNLKSEIRYVLYMAVGLILAAGIASIQLLPTFDLIRNTQRSGALPLEIIREGSLSLRRVLESFLGCNAMPQDAGDAAYIGAAGTFFLLWGIFASCRKHRWKDILLFSCFLSLGIAPFSILYAKILPGYGGFHDPRRILALAPVLAAPLMARGLTLIFKSRGLTNPGRFLFLFLAFFSVFFLWRGGKGNLQLWQALGWIPNLTWKGSVVFSGIVFIAISLSDLVVIFPARLGKALLIFLAILEILNYSFCRIDTKFIRERDIRPEFADTLKNDLSQNNLPRIFAFDSSGNYSFHYARRDLKESWLPNLAVIHGVSDFQGYDPLKPLRYHLFITVLNEPHAFSPRSPFTTHFGVIKNIESPLIGKTGITHAIGLGKNAASKLWKRIEIPSQSDPDIHEYAKPSGRFSFERNPLAVGSVEEAIEELRYQKITGDLRGVIEGGRRIQGSKAEKNNQTRIMEIAEFREGYARLKVNAPKDGYLIFREGWDSGWRAFIDGKEQEVFPADLAFLAVFLEKGEREIIWKYAPSSLFKGAMISCFSMLILILFVTIVNKGKSN